MIKIVSGFSIPVGSIVALVNLCNQFNEQGYDCIFYGPDHWHLDKCRAAGLADFHPEEGDIIIVHRIRLFSTAQLDNLTDVVEQSRKGTGAGALKNLVFPRLQGPWTRRSLKLVLTCQEKESFLGALNHALFDVIHYVHDSQLRYHGVPRGHFVCPNFSSELIPSGKKPERIAGIIGSIRKENKTDRLVEQAMEEGMETVVLYGYLIDPLYYYRAIEPLTEKYPGRIRFAGFVDNPQKVYDSLSDVYSSGRKAWSPVRRECRITGTRFHGPAGAETTLTDDEIFAAWKKALEL